MGQRKLTNRQEEILRFVRQELEQKGFPPSVREIGKAVGLSSSSTVHSHLRNLEKKGLIRRHPAKPRTIEVLTGKERRKPANYAPIIANPLTVLPISAQENTVTYYPLAEAWGDTEQLFLTKTENSMNEIGVGKGDLIVVSTNAFVSAQDTVVVLDGNLMRIETASKLETSSQDNNSPSILGKVLGVIKVFLSSQAPWQQEDSPGAPG